jgi:acyl carrier protein
MLTEQEIGTAATNHTAIRRIVAQHGHLSVDMNRIQDDSDLYLAGLTSLATVNLMLVLENHFDIEFPDSKLGRGTFASLNAIFQAVAELKGGCHAGPV